MNRRHMILLGVAMTTLALTSSAKAYTMERVEPVEPSLSIRLGSGRTFIARFGGISWPANWDYAQWYVDETLKYTQTIGGQTATSAFYNLGLLAPGTHEVKVRAQWNTVGINFWTNYLVWTVNVYAHPPVASRVSPDSPVTVHEGDTQAFTASGTDLAGMWDIDRVSWYLDGVHQADLNGARCPPPAASTPGVTRSRRQGPIRWRLFFTMVTTIPLPPAKRCGPSMSSASGP